MKKRLLSFSLALCMLLTLLPISAMAEEADTSIGASGEIIAFAPLDETERSVPTGTAIEDLGLPESLTATVKTAVPDDSGTTAEPIQDSGDSDEGSVSGSLAVATSGSAIEAETNEPQEQEEEETTAPEWEEKTVEIPVTWEATPEYQGNENGVYMFTPVIEGYTVRANLPEITVMVGEMPPLAAARALTATDYGIWVGTTKVTSANASDVLDDGTVAYDEGSDTLTLNNANITTLCPPGTGEGQNGNGSGNCGGIFRDSGDLKIALIGSNTVDISSVTNQSEPYGIYAVSGAVRITSDSGGSLTVTSASGTYSSYGIKGSGVSIEDCTVTATAGNNTVLNAVSYGIYTANGDNISIINATVTASSGSSQGVSVGISANPPSTLSIENSTVTANGGSSGNGKISVGLFVYGPTISSSTITATGYSQALAFGTSMTAIGLMATVTASANQDGSDATSVPLGTSVYGSSNYHKYVIITPAPAQWGEAGEGGTAPSTWTGGTLTEAMTYANGLDSGTAYIQIQEDVNTTEALTFVAGKTTILDLNGKDIDRGLSAANGNGNVITVLGHLTLKDSSTPDVANQGKITGGHNTGHGGGVYVNIGGASVNDGTFTMTGGNITGNKSGNNGGGVYVNGAFTMTGGSITNNEAPNWGGGLYMQGSFTMLGGSITGNKSAEGGVLFISLFTVGGSAVIRNNTVTSSSAERNVVVLSGRTISIDGSTPFVSGASIGVTAYSPPTSGSPVNVTGTNSGNYSSYFHSDDSGYMIQNSADNVVQLAVPAPTIGTLTIPGSFTAGHALALNDLTNSYKPVITNNGNVITAEGWQLYNPSVEGYWQTLESGSIIPDTVSASTLRYYAAYSGGTVYSNGVTLTVVGNTTTLALEADPASPQSTGSSVTLTATLTGFFAGTDGVNGQTITFKSNGTNLGNATLNSGGVAAYTWTPSVTGVYSLTAEYAGSEYNTGAVSAAVSYTVKPATPSANVVTVDYAAESISFDNTYEVSGSADFTTTTIASGSTIAPGTTYHVRVKAAGMVPASEAVDFTVAARPTAPGTVTEGNITKTDATITIANTLSAQEYSVDGTNWQTGNGSSLTFTGLNANHAYSVVTRIRATATSFASAPSATLSVTTKTAPAPLFGSGVTYSVKDKTITGLGDTYEYSLDGGSTWQITPTAGVSFEAGNIICVRAKETADAMPSQPQTLGTIVAMAAAPDYAIDFAGEKTTVSVPATAEYNTTSAGAETWTAGENAPLALIPDSAYYFRVAATDTALAGNVQTLDVPARPGAPDAGVVTIAAGNDARHTKLTLADTYEYILSESAPAASAQGTPGTGSAMEVSATAGQSVYIRVKATVSAFASGWRDCGAVQLGVNDITLTGVGYDIAAGTITGTTDNMEYSLDDGGTWQDCAEGDTTDVAFVAGNVKVRQKDKTTNERTLGAIIAAATSNTPTLESKTYNSVTLTAMTGYEYSKDGGATWQDSNLFSGLSSSTAYSFVARIKATAAALPGTTSVELNVTTNNRPSGGDGDSTGGGSDTPSKPADTKPTEPVTGSTENKATVDDKGNASVNLTDKNITDAIADAKAEAEKKGVNAGDITAVIHVTTDGKDANTVTVNLPKTTQEQVIGNKIASVQLVIDRPDLTISINLAAVTEINRQAKADVQLSATRMDNSKLSGDAKAAIGNRPTYDLKATYGSGKSVTDFGKGSVSVEIPYTLQKGEIAGNVYAVYVDAKGQVTYLTDSSYDAQRGTVIFSTSHFSTYGIAYKASFNFTDIGDHWAKDDILFVANRGLMTGTSATTFSPNGSMTRGMFVTALGRLANADISAYKQSSFTDVKADAYYMGYIEWGVKNNILVGIGGKFDPDGLVTREQMAVIMDRYATAIGFKLPEVHTQNVFADNAQIGAWAAPSVKRIQMAGIIQGKSKNLFDPQGTATRAEVSAVLRRFVELTVFSDTAQGWVKNDSGQWMYYENGKPITGKKGIDGSTYTFDRYGVTADVPKNLRYATYTVQKGDSFWLIAHKLGCSMSELERLNNKSRFSIIRPGDVLRVPEK